ncbi:DUF2125 domain-containing protein [Marimonas lutisalis]|uniref:DUF2125 domain-containing protein n=1 Tax=Marimonas lutisalis TaxID=2545756 RepID=UPI0010F81106|nr:DUF2125 domain-containing protein [Marimonas lutisalis]
MKRLLIFVVIAGLLWSGYWYVAASGARRGFETWFEARRAEGWQAEYSALTVRGFPNRVDTTFDAPVLADPETGLAWQAPFFQIFALSYKPNHIIAVWPKSQQISTPLAKYVIASEDMRASVVMAPEAKLPLERANLTAEAMAITPPDEAITTLDGLQAAISRVAGAEAEYRFAINADGVTPPSPRGLRLRTGGALPDRLETLRADMTVAFDRSWDLSALETGRPQPRRIKLKLTEAKWGQLELKLAGTLDVDAAGRPSGRLTVKAENWRDILALAQGMGWINATWAGRLEQGLDLASALSGNPNTLDIPLDFADGSVALGPIPLGAAPRLRLR